MAAISHLRGQVGILRTRKQPLKEALNLLLAYQRKLREPVAGGSNRWPHQPEGIGLPPLSGP